MEAIGNVVGEFSRLVNDLVGSWPWPEAWKPAKVERIPKKRHIQTFGDLRPIMLVTICQVVCEGVVVDAQALAWTDHPFDVCFCMCTALKIGSFLTVGV